MAAVRNSARALTVVTGVLSSLATSAVVLAAPALASAPDNAYDAGPGLTVPQTLGLFVGIPLLVILVIYGLVYGLTGRRGPRYPAGQPYTGDPVVFGDDSATSDSAPPGSGAPGSAATEAADATPGEPEGGARGQW